MTRQTKNGRQPPPKLPPDANCRRAAVERHGKDTRHRGFANPAMTAEDVTVRDPLLLDRVLQGAGDVFLADDVGEFLRPIFARENLVTHGRKLRLYGLGLWNGKAPTRA